MVVRAAKRIRVPLDDRRSSCRCDAMLDAKDERLQIRVDSAEKRLLERAAAASHSTVSAFVLRAALAHAVEVLANRPLIELDADLAAVFTDALNSPANVNDRLASVLRRPRKSDWID